MAGDGINDALALFYALLYNYNATGVALAAGVLCHFLGLPLSPMIAGAATSIRQGRLPRNK
jgi:hypothetical protein